MRAAEWKPSRIELIVCSASDTESALVVQPIRMQLPTKLRALDESAALSGQHTQRTLAALNRSLGESESLN